MAEERPALTARLGMRTLALAALLVLPLAAAADPPVRRRLPQEELARETYALVTDPDNLPMQVREMLARELKQRRLRMAVAGEPYLSGDAATDRALPPHRLILAAVGEKHAIVHFESGGETAARRVMVFELTSRGTELIWSGPVKRRLSAPVEFEAALKDGRLFEDER